MELLSPVEARVLGSLMEKSATTPEYYPLSLNALIAACNQKSSREPVMELEEQEVRAALHSLTIKGLAARGGDGRVPKFEHRAGEQWNLRRDEFALLCCLLLRGPQTPGELRTRTERLHAFEELDAVISAMERMAANEPPLVQPMPRQPGSREQRWRQLVSEAAAGDPPGPAAEVYAAESEKKGELGTLRAEIAELRERVEVLEARAALTSSSS